VWVDSGFEGDGEWDDGEENLGVLADEVKRVVKVRKGGWEGRRE